MSIKKLCVAVLMATSAIPVIAEETPIVVTASRTSQSLDETLSPTIVISRKQIEQSRSTDIAELLRFHAGLDIGRNGGAGQTTSLFLRGTESNHTIVMIDGIKINPGTIGGAALQHINPELIEHIEIVKGPLSSRYGSEAIGGVINIITRKSGKKNKIFSGIKTGSDHTYQINAGTYNNFGDFKTGFDVVSSKTDGFSTRTDSSIDRGNENLSFKLFANTRISGNDIEFNHWQSQGETEYLSGWAAPYTSVDQDYQNSSSSINITSNLTRNWVSTFKLSHITDIIDQNQSNDFAHTRRNTLDWQNDIVTGEHQLITLGLQSSRERTKSLSSGTAFNKINDVNDIYIQDEINYLNHQVLLSVRRTDHDDFGGHNTWNINYGYNLSKATKLLASAGTGFRAPDSTDRFGFGGNSNLKPEESRNIEIGLRHSFNTGFSSELALFENKITNLISYFDPDGWGGAPGQNKNIQDARIRGLEITFNYNEGPWLTRISGILQDPIYKVDPVNGNVNVQLARRAKRSITGSIRYAKSNYDIGMEILSTSRRKDSDYSSTWNKAYTLTNITGSYKVNKKWSIQGRIENLFNKGYTLANGYNTQDRSAFLTINYSYQ